MIINRVTINPKNYYCKKIRSRSGKADMSVPTNLSIQQRAMEEIFLKTWDKIKINIHLNLDRLTSLVERRAHRIVLLSIVVYTLIFSAFTIFMHYGFKTYAWDLGIFTQSMWSTINLGKPLYYSIEAIRNPSLNFLGAHFSPILFLIVPVYALYQSPLTLLILQSFIIGLAALPLYWIAKNKLNSKLWGLTFALAYLLHPALHGMNCFDFHVEAFIPLFFLLTFHYFDTKQWTRGLLFFILTLSTIEFAPILTISLGLYFFLKATSQKAKTPLRLILKHVSPAILLVIVSIFWFYASFYATYSLNPLKATGLPGNWDNWGRSLPEVILNVLKDPLRALSTMANPLEKPYYIIFALAPLLFLPALAPLELLLYLPWMLAALLSDYSPYYQPYFQYFGFMAAQIFIAAVFGTHKLLKTINGKVEIQGLERKLMALILVLSLTSAIAISPIGLPALTRRPIQITPHTNMLLNVLTLIPSNASVATQNDILPHIAQREHVYILDWPMKPESDYIIVDLKSSHVFYGPTPTSFPPVEALNGALDNGYGIMASADGILLLKKSYSGSLLIYEPYEELFDYTDLYAFPISSYVRFDGSSKSGSVIIHSTEHRTGWMWAGPYKWLPNGQYNATFRIKTESNNLDFIIDVLGTELNITTSAWSNQRLAYKTLSFSDFEGTNIWHEFTLSFTIDHLAQMEFRGWCESNNTYVMLDYVKVAQTQP